MAQRQEAQLLVAVADRQHAQERSHGEHDVLLGDHRAFRRTGGPGGVDQHRDVAGSRCLDLALEPVVVRDVERGPCVLLHHQHGDPALLVEAADDGEDVADEDGRQAERGLVEQHDLRPRHESARDGEHLLLPAGERARGLAKPLAEDREVAEYHLQVLVHAVVVSRIRPHREVLTDGEQRKHLPALGHVHDALAHDPVRIAALDGLPGQANLALLGVHDAGDGPKQGGLPGSVRAQHRDDPPLRHVEAHTANRHDRSVEALEIADLEQRIITAHAAAPVPAPVSVS